MKSASLPRFDRTIAGAAMVVAPAVFVVAELLHGRFETDAANQLAVVADNAGRWYAAHVLVLAALMLALPAFVGVAHLVQGSRPLLGSLSLLAFVPGLVVLAGIVGMELVLWQMAQPGRDRAEMVSLLDSVGESAGVALLFLAALLFPIAWLLVGVGLYVARLVPRWSAALVGLAQLVGFASELSGGPKWLAVAAQLAFAAGLIPIGIRVLRQSDAAREALQVAAGPRPTPA